MLQELECGSHGPAVVGLATAQSQSRAVGVHAVRLVQDVAVDAHLRKTQTSDVVARASQRLEEAISSLKLI